jgi:hypothetical protein
VRALVSDADLVGVVETQVDRVHDAAMRLGCTVDEAYQVAQDAALELVSDLATQPETVGDLVGGLFARCRAVSRTLRSGQLTPGPAVVGDDEAQAVAAAVAEVPERRRLAVLLIDAYGLTYAQAAVALELDVAETARTVALGRATLVAEVDEREAPSLAGHDVAIGDLGQLSDGSAPAGGRFAGLRQHVSGCATCAQNLGVQTRGRGMLGAVPVLALDPAGRGELIERVAARAAAALPTVEEVEGELAGGPAPQPLVPAWVWVAAVVLAVTLGVLLGILLSGSG